VVSVLALWFVGDASAFRSGRRCSPVGFLVVAVHLSFLFSVALVLLPSPPPLLSRASGWFCVWFAAHFSYGVSFSSSPLPLGSFVGASGSTDALPLKPVECPSPPSRSVRVGVSQLKYIFSAPFSHSFSSRNVGSGSPRSSQVVCSGVGAPMVPLVTLACFPHRPFCVFILAAVFYFYFSLFLGPTLPALSLGYEAILVVEMSTLLWEALL